MYKIITLIENRVVVDFTNSLERANEIYERYSLDIKRKFADFVVLAYVPENPKEIETIRYCHR